MEYPHHSNSLSKRGSGMASVFRVFFKVFTSRSVGSFQVQGCRISTGDDNIVIKEGSKNILVEKCWLLDGHGTSLGSLGEANSFGSIEDVVVRNVVYNRTRFGARIKTWQWQLTEWEIPTSHCRHSQTSPGHNQLR
eukprot:3740744-Pyramimonas_sp.AAC.1